MKTILTITMIIIFTILFLISCTTATTDEPNVELIPSRLNAQNIIWIEEGETFPSSILDNEFPISFRQIDLSAPNALDSEGAAFINGEFVVRSLRIFEFDSQTVQSFFVQMGNRNQAAINADAFFINSASDFRDQMPSNFYSYHLNEQLRSVVHDTSSNVWIFSYIEPGVALGWSTRVAVDGNSGDVLKVWIG